MRWRTALPVLAGFAVFLGIGVLVLALVLGSPAKVSGQQATGEHAGHPAMSDAAMKRWAEQWWATHPRVGARSYQPAAVTFTVANFQFNADGNTSTLVDTVTISMGSSVSWQWLGGAHSITSGTGFDDPQAGALFEQPSDTFNPQFSFTFNTSGTYPFFCRPHEGFGMKGVVIVGAAAGVEPAGAALGFTAGPSPRPTRAGVSFGFALRGPGRVRAEIFDARGRRVATAIDRDYAAGTYTGAWNGRTEAGADASTGMYFLRLRLPGYVSSRQVVITR